MDYKIKPCKTKAAFSVIPVQKIKLDFDKLKIKFETLIDNPIALVIKVDDEEIVVHNYGEMLFKTLKNVEKIKTIADRIYEVGV
ncbi:hypothetical protein KY328_05720 [Candidatus Woesearchaeota archaeon]|nr:hypothetical protein [Candidatus Woesearchaeota archaeon]MBW3022397.1 hypothetical protein [Candidatus Woesearchaeota archaeon]